MSLHFYWFLPTGDGRDIAGGGHGVHGGSPDSADDSVSMTPFAPAPGPAHPAAVS